MKLSRRTFLTAAVVVMVLCYAAAVPVLARFGIQI